MSGAYILSDSNSLTPESNKLSNLVKDSKNIIDSWLNEYKNLFDINSFDEILTQKRKSQKTKEIIENWLHEYQGLFNLIQENSSQTFSIEKFDCFNIDLNYKKVPENSNIRLRNQTRVGYWGPLLRYGTYGIYKRYATNVSLKENDKRKRNLKLELRTVSKVPFFTPMHIHIPRQAMLCTIESKVKHSMADINYLKKDPVKCQMIKYAKHLEKITNVSGTCPKYIFCSFKSIPTKEKEYFSYDNEITKVPYLSLDGNKLKYVPLIDEYMVCELYISDIILSQCFALWKSRAKEACAREALNVLSNSECCYIMGAVRFWDNTDFLCAVLSTNASLASVMPPFVTDPTEPLYKKDEKINESDEQENYQIRNPKLLDDFWLFAPLLTERKLIKTLNPQQLIYQSAEFSQMHLSYELGTNWTSGSSISNLTPLASFYCSILLDNTEIVRATGLASLQQAKQVASLLLVDKLISSQPIIVLNDQFKQRYEDLLNGNGDNNFLIDSLLWSKDSLKSPLSLQQLKTELINQDLISQQNASKLFNTNGNIENLDELLILYSQSCVIDSILIEKPTNIDTIKHQAHSSGLLATVDGALNVIICKQIPHIGLKSILLRENRCGIFELLYPGKLSSDYIKQLNVYYDSHHYDSTTDDQNSCDKNKLNDECLFLSNEKRSVQISTDKNSDILFNQNSSFLNNNRNFIPGIDF